MDWIRSNWIVRIFLLSHSRKFIKVYIIQQLCICTKIIMSQFLSNNLRRSLIDPTLKASVKYRISKRNNSMTEYKQKVSHSQIEQLCTAKNYEQLDDTSVRLENKRLKMVLRQLNDTLTYRVERKKLRIEPGDASFVSMKELMEYVPQDFHQEGKRNLEIIQELKKELDVCVARKKVIQDVNYRNKIEQETDRILKMNKEIEESIRTIKRMFVLREKEIKQLGKYNQGEQMFTLRRQLTKTHKHIEEVENRLEETELQNNRIYEKILIITDKKNSLQVQYYQSMNAKREAANHLLAITQNNQIYLEHLTRLKNSKRRCHTSDELYKVKYYNALKKLDGEAERVSKLDGQIKQLEYQIFLKREFCQRLAVKLEEVQTKNNKSYFEEAEIGGSGFMITEIQTGKKSKKSQINYSQHSSTIKSGNLEVSEGENCQSLYY